MNSASIEESLRSSGLTARELYALWEQGQPTGDTKKRQAAGVLWIPEDLDVARHFVQRAVDLEEYLLVCDVAKEALQHWAPADEAGKLSLVKLRMHYAEALTRLGRTRDARAELDECAEDSFPVPLPPRLKMAILLQLGDILREEAAHAAAREMKLQTAQEALAFYDRALALAGPEELRPLVLSAAASQIVSAREPARKIEAQSKARNILRIAAGLEQHSGPSFDIMADRGIAHALLGDIDAAAAAFAKLEHFPEATTGRLAGMRYHTEFLAESLGHARDIFRPAFPPLELVVFAGHRPDKPGSGLRRFPLEKIEQVRAAIRERLQQRKVRVGLVGADAGADLLFGEAVLQRGGTLHVVLPWSRQEFHRTNVAPFEPRTGEPVWKPIFEKNLEKAATVRELGQAYEPSSDLGFEYAMEVTAGLALHIARVSRLDLKPMVLWDEVTGGAVGGTSSYASFWSSQLGHELEVLPIARDGEPSALDDADVRDRRCERAILQHEVKSMLFADIVGYSRLTEHAIPEFVGLFLERVSRLAAGSNHRPRSLNTWGDAVFAVFDFARDAGAFALELIRMIQEGRPEWLRAGLYWEETKNGETVKHPLNVRIGLHTGPVFMHFDPVVRRLGFTGAHVNRAARIEPIAREGEAYASEEFAALATLDAELRKTSGSQPAVPFVCEYGGTMPLAKGYPGRYRIYRVLPYRVLELEELAKAVHELYCAKELKRGEKAENNYALRPWEHLPEDLKNANRAQVADIPTKLRLLGYELAPHEGLAASEIEVDDATLERLSIREHARWMADRRQNGWTFGEKRDDARKLHHLLIPWEQLSELEKDKDRDTIRNLPALVAKAGFRVRKLKR